MASKGSAGAGPVGTKEVILEAAFEVLRTDGLVGLSTRRVAAEAGVNQALVHYHYGSIDNLLLEVMGQVSAGLTPKAEGVFLEEGDLGKKWKRYVSRERGEGHPPGIHKIWLEMVAYVLSRPELEEVYIRDFLSPTFEAMRTAVLEAMPATMKDREAKAEALASLIQAVNRGVILDRLLGWTRGHTTMIALVEEMIQQTINPPKDGKRSTGSSGPAKRTKKKR